MDWYSGTPREAREYTCCVCGLSTRSEYVPADWYGIGKHEGGATPVKRMGLMCSLKCLLRRAQLAYEIDRPGTQMKRDGRRYFHGFEKIQGR